MNKKEGRVGRGEGGRETLSDKEGKKRMRGGDGHKNNANTWQKNGNIK